MFTLYVPIYLGRTGSDFAAFLRTSCLILFEGTDSSVHV